MFRMLFACAVVCLFSTQLLAVPIPLVEFSYDSGLQFMPGSVLPSSVDFSFGTTLGTPETRTHWAGQYTPSDIGQTLLAPPDVVAGVSATITNPNVIFTMNIGQAPRFGGYDDLTPPTGNDNDLGTLRMTLFVPNPSSYQVRSIERTINNVVLQWVPSGEGKYFHIGGKQTILLYGEQIPEPSTFLLVGICLAMLPVTMRWPQRW